MSGTRVETTRKAYNRPEELASSVAYAIGCAAALVGLVFLLRSYVGFGGIAVFSVAVCGIASVAVFFIGTLTHLLPHNGKAACLFARFDRASLAVLVLGVFSPIFLVGFDFGAHVDAVWGYTLFSIVAAAVIAAVVVNLLEVKEYKIVSLVLYVIIGWALVIRAHRIIALCGARCFWTLIGGLAAYFIGLCVCAFESIPSRHAISHAFIVVGAALDFVCIYTFLL
ncbi:MAG: hypothetical protein J1G01_07010 [Clostridiales bacterium]|nr:hypothetical protein [Clostridiales bacterium]